MVLQMRDPKNAGLAEYQNSGNNCDKACRLELANELNPLRDPTKNPMFKQALELMEHWNFLEEATDILVQISLW